MRATIIESPFWDLKVLDFPAVRSHRGAVYVDELRPFAKRSSESEFPQLSLSSVMAEFWLPMPLDEALMRALRRWEQNLFDGLAHMSGRDVHTGELVRVDIVGFSPGTLSTLSFEQGDQKAPVQLRFNCGICVIGDASWMMCPGEDVTEQYAR